MVECLVCFLQRRFIERLVLACLHLVVLSIAIYLRPSDPNDLMGPTDTASIVSLRPTLVVIVSGISGMQ